MDGRNLSIIHSTDLVEPIGLTIDYVQQLLFWIDAVRDRIESSSTDGSNRRVISDEGIFHPFDITLYRDDLYFTDILTGLRKVSRHGGTVTTVIDRVNLCEEVAGIEVLSSEHQPAGMNSSNSNDY